jgi:TIGR03009 family protein
MTQPLVRPHSRVRVRHNCLFLLALGGLAASTSDRSAHPALAQASRPPAKARVGEEPAAPAAAPRAAAPRATAPRATAPAAQPAAAKPGQAIRPVAAEMKVPAVEALDPKMWKVLQDWELATKDIKALYAEHQRFVYDQTFSIEKRGEGRVWYESPDHGRYEVDPSNVKGQKTKKLDANGTPFTLQAHEPEKWICTGAEVIKVNDAKKEYEKIVIPQEDRGMNMMNGPLPFIIGMKADQARRRYYLKLLKHENGEIWVHARPREQRDATLWSDAIVILDEKTFLPRAVQLTDPTGYQTTTHTFKKMDPRTKEFAKTGFPAWIAGGDPFAFNAKGYQPAMLEGAPQNVEAKPGATKSRIPPTSLDGRTEQRLAQPPTGAPKRVTN